MDGMRFDLDDLNAVIKLGVEIVESSWFAQSLDGRSKALANRRSAQSTPNSFGSLGELLRSIPTELLEGF